MHERNEEDIRTILSEVLDPEIPVLNVVEMGIVRNISFENESVQVAIAPTYSGCPAMRTIEGEIELALNKAGYVNPEVTTVYSELWSSDFMTTEAKQKLEEYGIAPPLSTDHPDADLDGSLNRSISCPFCKSVET
ncbi:MAG: phenylacetate-CoA oxygenase subunit PaaJ, partial [Rhodothermales bacterium]|nr:phenylacetate-CoA oxygenase subunit PaaJ [Rhodothermales bacterium]